MIHSSIENYIFQNELFSVTLRLFFLNAVFKSFLILSFFLNSSCLKEKLNSITTMQDRMKNCYLQQRFSSKLFSDFKILMFNIGNKIRVHAIKNEVCLSLATRKAIIYDAWRAFHRLCTRRILGLMVDSSKRSRIVKLAISPRA